MKGLAVLLLCAIAVEAEISRDAMSKEQFYNALNRIVSGENPVIAGGDAKIAQGIRQEIANSKWFARLKAELE